MYCPCGHHYLTEHETDCDTTSCSKCDCVIEHNCVCSESGDKRLTTIKYTGERE